MHYGIMVVNPGRRRDVHYYRHKQGCLLHVHQLPTEPEYLATPYIFCKLTTPVTLHITVKLLAP